MMIGKMENGKGDTGCAILSGGSSSKRERNTRFFQCIVLLPNIPLLPAGDGDVIAGGALHVDHVLHVGDRL